MSPPAAQQDQRLTEEQRKVELDAVMGNFQVFPEPTQLGGALVDPVEPAVLKPLKVHRLVPPASLKVLLSPVLSHPFNLDPVTDLIKQLQTFGLWKM